AADVLDFLNAKHHAVGGRLHGIQHCAVKESNLLLCGDFVRVADFERATTSSVPHSLASGRHTINYWATEIFDGYVSPYSDQYSLAVTYFKLRTGELPFRAIAEAQTYDVVKARNPRLDLLLAQERMPISRALRPVPQDRWPTCAEMMRELAKCV